MLPIAATTKAYWFLARGTGAVSLVLLTISVVLGILGSLRYASAPRWPRFAIDSLHRDVSLMVLALLAVHIVVSVLDSFAPIKLTDAVIPFAASYRPLWMGFGALAFDLLLALVITSLLRRRLGYSTWRAIHWLAYASWPVAVLHGLGTGSDTKVWWMLLLTAVCMAAVVVAALTRIARTEEGGFRAPAVVLSIAAPIAIAIFTLAGPLAPHWARRAGTPATLLGKSLTPVAARVHQPSSSSSSSSSPPPATTLKAPFSAQLAGKVTQTQEPGGAIVDLALRLSGGAHGKLRIRLAGAPLDGGGLSMTGSQVDMLVGGIPEVMEGRIVSLQGDQFIAHVSGVSGSSLDLHATLQIDQNSGSVNGSLHATDGSAG